MWVGNGCLMFGNYFIAFGHVYAVVLIELVLGHRWT